MGYLKQWKNKAEQRTPLVSKSLPIEVYALSNYLFYS